MKKPQEHLLDCGVGRGGQVTEKIKQILILIYFSYLISLIKSPKSATIILESRNNAESVEKLIY
jgi:hypothetical protein